MSFWRFERKGRLENGHHLKDFYDVDAKDNDVGDEIEKDSLFDRLTGHERNFHRRAEDGGRL